MDRHATGQHPAFDEMRSIFEAAPEEYGPVPIWWWSGAKLEKKEMTRQLEMLAKGGVRHLMTVNLAPAGTIYGCLPDDPMMLTEKWWDYFNHALQECKRLGIHWWFYDQLGFSGASLQARVVLRNAEHAGAKLKRIVRLVEGPAEVSLEAPSFGQPLGAFMGKVKEKGSNPGDAEMKRPVLEKVRKLSGHLTGHALKAQVPQGLHSVELYYSVRAGFDYHSPEAGSELLDILHGEVERRFGPDMGTAIAGSFQDELPSMPRFSVSMAEQFRKRAGYDLLECLPALFNEISDAGNGSNMLESGQVRCDAARVAAELCEEAFFIPLAEYHLKHNMWCGFDQTIRNGDPIAAERYYVDYFRTHRHFSVPGNEQSGEAKPHQAMAELYKRPRVWMEGFHSSGWGQTMEDIITLLHPWIAEGSTLYNPHAIYFGTQGSYWEWAPPDTGWRQPYFAHYPYLVHYVERLCYLMTRGNHVVSDALLYPASTVHAGSGWGVTDADARAANAAYWDAQKAYRACHQDYLIIDECSIQKGRIVNGVLHAGLVEIRTILLPACRYLEGATLTRLLEFAESGGRIVCIGTAPERRADGAIPAEEFSRAATQLCGKAIRISDTSAAPVQSAMPLRIESPIGPLAGMQRRIGDRHFWYFLSDDTIPPNAPALRQVNQVAHWDTLAAKGARLAVKLPGDGMPEHWDAASGRVAPILNFRREGTATQVEVELRESPAPLVALRPADAADPKAIESDLEIASWERVGDSARVSGWERLDRSQEPRNRHHARLEFPDAAFESAVDAVPPKRLELVGPFDFTLEPTCNNDDASFDYPAYKGAIPVETRGFQFAEETDPGVAVDWSKPEYDDTRWSRALASFGPRARWAGPVSLQNGESFDTMALPRIPEQSFVPAAYSLKLGIYQDFVFTHSHGSRGRISDEFVDVGEVKPGDVYLIEAIIFLPEKSCSDSMEALLRVGSRSLKRVFLNGKEIRFNAPPTAQKIQTRVVLHPGPNHIQILAARQKPGRLRLFYHFLHPAEAPQDPQWIWFEQSRRMGITRFSKVFTLTEESESAAVAVALADLKHQVRVNGHVVAQQGGFDPYFTSRADRYNIQPFLKKGENRFEVDVIYMGESIGAGEFTDVFEGTKDRDEPVGLLVDGMVCLKSGRRFCFISDESFRTVEVDESGAEMGDLHPVRLLLEPLHNYFSTQENLLLESRPHGLPEAGWLQNLPGPKAPFDRVIYAMGDTSARPGWYRFLLPPGAKRMCIRLCAASVEAGAPQLFVDGIAVPLEKTACRSAEHKGICFEAELPNSLSPRRQAAIRIIQVAGYMEGAAFLEPIRYEMGPGRIELGPWDDLGFPNYSGGIIYSTAFEWSEEGDKGKAILELGRVRGSVDVTVNGKACGTRIWHPFRFDVTAALKKGENRVDIRVFNTLGPHFGEGHPSGYVFENQTRSGIYGPVSITQQRRIDLELRKVR